jgi:hypothetical protein
MRCADGNFSTGGNGTKFKGCSTRLPDPRLDVFGQLIKMHMSQGGIVTGIDHTDQRPRKINIIISAALVNGPPMGGAISRKKLLIFRTITHLSIPLQDT